MTNTACIVLFQNISCYCLTPTSYPPFFLLSISKHLMLLFNTTEEMAAAICRIFQNISCYCLTAPVIVIANESDTFQNISCYCLTMLRFGSLALETSFQNISCYCLTNEKSLFLNRFLQKRTIL